MLSDRDLALMRMTSKETLPDRASHERRTHTPDGYGNQRDDWTRVGWINCRISEDTSREDEQGGKTTATGEYTATVPFDTNVLPTDRLVINGTIYEVAQICPVTSWETSQKVKVKKVV